jgi:hypothetical protein
MLMHPNGNVRVAFKIGDCRLALGTLRKVFQKRRSDVHMLEVAAGLGFRVLHFRRGIIKPGCELYQPVWKGTYERI